MTSRAILIDPTNRTVTEVQVEDWRAIQRWLSLDGEDITFTVITLDDDHVIYLDDEGLLKHGVPAIKWLGYGPLVGKLLLLGQDGEGDEADCKFTVEQVSALFEWTDLATTGNFNDDGWTGTADEVNGIKGPWVVVNGPTPIFR